MPANEDYIQCTISVRFKLGTPVYIDQDESIKAWITGYCWRSEDEVTVECSWIYNGVSYSTWIQQWRLTSAS